MLPSGLNASVVYQGLNESWSTSRSVARPFRGVDVLLRQRQRCHQDRPGDLLLPGGGKVLYRGRPLADEGLQVKIKGDIAAAKPRAHLLAQIVGRRRGRLGAAAASVVGREQIAHGSGIAPEDRAAAPVAFQRQGCGPVGASPLEGWPIVRRARKGPRCKIKRGRRRRGPPAKALLKATNWRALPHMGRGIVRDEEILRLLLRNPDADGGAAQIPHVIGATRTAGVGEADRDRVLLARLKVPDLKLLGNFGKHAKPGVGHAKKHFRMRGALDAIRPAFSSGT